MIVGRARACISDRLVSTKSAHPCVCLLIFVNVCRLGVLGLHMKGSKRLACTTPLYKKGNGACTPIPQGRRDRRQRPGGPQNSDLAAPRPRPTPTDDHREAPNSPWLGIAKAGSLPPALRSTSVARFLRCRLEFTKLGDVRLARRK